MNFQSGFEHIISIFGENLSYAGIAVAIMFLAKKWQDYRTVKYDDDVEITEKNNLALALRRSSFYLAVALALAGAIRSDGDGYWQKMLDVLIDGAVALVVLGIAQVVVDRVMLSYIDNNAAIGSDNRAVGFIEAGAYAAIGCIFFGSFAGEGGGVLSAVVFSLLGLFDLLILYWIIEAMTAYNLAGHIKANNVSAGVLVGMRMITLGLILGASIFGPFTGWVQDLKAFGLSAVFGLVMLWLLMLVVDWLFLPKTTIDQEVEEKNPAANLLAEAVAFAVAVVVVAVIV